MPSLLMITRRLTELLTDNKPDLTILLIDSQTARQAQEVIPVKIARFLALCAIASALASASAMAQYESEAPSKWNIKLGIHRLMGSDDRELLGGTWYTQEVIYDFRQDSAGRPTHRASLSYSEPSQSRPGSMLATSASKLWWKDADNGNAFYLGAGIGAYKLKLPGVDGAKIGAQLLGGYSFGSGYFAELRLLAVPSWNAGPSLDVNTSGISLSLGTRQLF